MLCRVRWGLEFVLTIPFNETVKALPATTPFVGPEALERQRQCQFAARIGANESAFGLSARALRAMQEALVQCVWYGDPENYALREALASRHGVAMEEICVDAGIDSLLGLCVRMLTDAQIPVITSLGAYPTFNYHVNGFGARLVTVPYRDDREDPDALLAAAKREQAPLIYFSNPDNPMGTWHDATTVQGLIDELPDQSVLALDEAYIEFAPAGSAPPIDTNNPQVIRLRTFSKAYGMAGLRIGYAIAHRELITGLNKIRNHFAVNRIAQVGALASLQDDVFLAEVQTAAAAGRERIRLLAKAHGLATLPSATNFVAVDLGHPERAGKLLKELAKRDVFIRMPGVEPLSRCVRIGIGTGAEHAHLDDVFGAALASV